MKHGNYIINFIFFFFVAFGIITFKEIDVSASSITLDELHSEFQANTAVTKSDGYWDTRLTSLGFNFVRQHQFYNNYKSHMYTYVITDKKMKNYGSSVVGSFDSSKCIVIVVKKFDDGTEYVGGFGFSEDRYFLNFYGYDTIYETAYNCPDGLENVDSSWSNETLSDIDVSDVNTYPIGHIELVTPPNGSDVYLNYDNERIGYYVNDITVKGKIPFAVENGVTLDYETVHDKMLGCLSFPNGSITDGNGNTDIYDPYTYDDLPYWDTNLELYGNYLDWVKNGYITFQFSFDLLVDVPGATTFEQWTYKLPIKYSKFLFMTDFETKDYVITSHSFNIKVYTDLNGDGVDDDTGENIPGDYLKPPVDDSWESKSWVEKLEYILTSIPSFIGSIFDSIISTLTHITSLVNSVISQGGTIGSLVSDLFNFFPDPIPQMITLTLGVMIFITFLSWVKK